MTVANLFAILSLPNPSRSVAAMMAGARAGDAYADQYDYEASVNNTTNTTTTMAPTLPAAEPVKLESELSSLILAGAWIPFVIVMGVAFVVREPTTTATSHTTTTTSHSACTHHAYPSTLHTHAAHLSCMQTTLKHGASLMSSMEEVRCCGSASPCCAIAHCIPPQR
jgi:hypothetical protein